jgi:pimeloyl-ACP methyl ester carboxylesterase/DNA-binding winged helix-turn-helix (wHTH) protein
MTPETILDFAGFRLDPFSGQLYHRAAPVPLTPKAFALLSCLARQAGRLVSKQELLDAVWPGVFVGDAVLKSTIREVRKALGDDPHAPQFIETAHRRGYRFIAVPSEQPVEMPAVAGVTGGLGSIDAGAARALAVGAAHPVGMSAAATLLPPAVPPVGAAAKVRYAHSGSVNIAYQVVGSGPIDMVFVMGWVSHLEYFWNEPSFARFLERLGSMARLILFDKRGTGLSDPVPVAQLPTLEQRLDDVRAVMEAAGSERAVLLGVSEGGTLCSLFAATYPEKTEALVMVGSYARRLRDIDYPWGPTPEERDRFCQSIVDEWGGPVGIEDRAPTMAADPAFREWWASYLRMGASPGAAVALTRMNAAIDIRDVLPSIRVPTLVLHRRGDRCLKIEEGRYLASRIPGATFVELPGEDHLPFVGNQEEMLLEIEAFLTRAHVRETHERVLATVLTVLADPSGADEAHLRRVFAGEVAWHRGRCLDAGGSRLVAAFDGPGRAVQCGCSVAAIASRSRIPVRAGVHVGECDLSSPAGPVLDIGGAIAQAADQYQVLASRTVVDLVPGSGLRFSDRGTIPVPGLSRDLGVLSATRG